MRIQKSILLTAVMGCSSLVLAGSTDDIAKAADPSAAIQVYVNAPDRSSAEVERAYVRRMDELGTPELADSQAKDIVARDAHDSIGWAAIAESHAKRGNMVEAIGAIVNVSPQTDDPAALAAAGRLSAWYQNFGNTLQIDPAVKQRMDDLSSQLANKLAFADAMNKAKQAYATQSAPQTAQSNAAPTNAAVQANVPAQINTQAAQAPQVQAAQSSIVQPGQGMTVQVNPGPYGGTPVQAPVVSGDVNVPQREYVSGDTVYQGTPYYGTTTYSYGALAPAYVSTPVYAAPTYYPYDAYPYYGYYGSPYYYGPDVYLGVGLGYGYGRFGYDRFYGGRSFGGFDRGHFDARGLDHGGGGFHDGGHVGGGGGFHGGGGGHR